MAKRVSPEKINELITLLEEALVILTPDKSNFKKEGYPSVQEVRQTLEEVLSQLRVGDISLLGKVKTLLDYNVWDAYTKEDGDEVGRRITSVLKEIARKPTLEIFLKWSFTLLVPFIVLFTIYPTWYYDSTGKVVFFLFILPAMLTLALVFHMTNPFSGSIRKGRLALFILSGIITIVGFLLSLIAGGMEQRW